MSATVDSRVVEMRFDNSQFERNVSTSMSTLEKLKQKLNLSGASKGLENLSSAAKNNNLNVLASAADTVGLRFDAMYTIADQALRNITTRVQQTAESMVKALTIDPIKSGFQEYETQINAVQTILANTSSKGTTLEQVNAALDELNHYADKTIYNFTEMTRNIGTFTAAGIDLDTSVSAIQGIANLAAVSGSTSQQASTAMYQLSQALASGTVKLMDWNSVVNAGMGGEVFQNALKNTARVHGVAIDEMIEKEGSFRETLSKGWLTSDILTQTLKQFTMAAEEGTEEWEAYKKSLMDTGYSEEQANAILKMGNTATDAATKVKTFSQLWDTLKEAAQSGWTQTWELIIGDFEEAKEFLTGLSDFFNGIIGASADRRNNLLGDALGSNWDKLTSKINEAGIETADFEEKVRECAKAGGVDVDKMMTEYGSLGKAFREGAVDSKYLTEAFEKITTGATKVKNKLSVDLGGIKDTLKFGSVGEDVKTVQTALVDLGFSLDKFGVDGIIGPETTAAIKAFQESAGLVANGIVDEKTLSALQKAGTSIEEIGDKSKKSKVSIDDLVDVITQKSGRELLLDSFMNVIKAIHRPLAAVSEAFRDMFSVKPTQIYKALESLNKFTSKFVMKGVLDVTTWDELTAKITGLGISLPQFYKKLYTVLNDHGISVEKLKKQYGSLGNAFTKGAISMDIIKETLLSFDGVTESMLLGGETAEKVRRAFAGLFAALKLVGSIAGGGVKVAFKILSAIFDSLGMSALDVAANVGDALVAFEKWVTEGNIIAQAIDWLISKIPLVVTQFKEWFAAFKETPAVQKLVSAIDAISTAFSKLKNGEINISDFAKTLGTNLAEALKSLPEIAVQIAKDFIAGFINGLGGGISDIIGKVVQFCLDFVSAFAAALGVHSPSWKAYQIAVDFIQGFINGIKTAIGVVISVLKQVGEQIVKVFKSFWDFITDESGNIEWGKIFAAGIIIAMVWTLKQLATAFSGIANAFDGIGDLLENAGKVLKSFSKVLDGVAWDLKAQALQKMAIAIAILVASIWVLTQIDDIGKLWNAVGVIAVLAVILVGLALAMDKLNSAALKVDKSGAKLEGLKSGLLQIGIALLLVAAVVKMIGSMPIEQAKQGFAGLAVIAVGMIAFLAAMAGISCYAKDVSGLTNMLMKLSIAMMLMVIACKMVSMLSAEDMLQGAVFAAAFAVFVIAITKVAKNAGNNVSKVGGLAIKLAIAMGLMVGVCKLVGMLSAGEMFKGAIFAAAFVVFLRALVNATKIGKKQQIAKLGGLVLSVSASLLLMVGVCKLVGKLTVGEMLKGAAFVAGFVILLKVLVEVLTIGNDQKLAKVSSTILAMSVAIGIMAGVAILLSFVSLADLAKGIAAVTILSAMMALMVKSLKGAQNAKGAIMMMAIAIGVMAAAVVALSLLDIGDLAASTAALSALMGMFALMTKSLKGLQKVPIGPLIAMAGVIVLLAGIVAVLSHAIKDPASAIAAVGSLSVLMVTMTVLLAAVSAIGKYLSSGIVTGIVSLTAMVIPLIAFVNVLKQLDGIEDASEKIKSLVTMMTAMTLLLGVLTLVGLGGPAAIIGIGSLVVLFAAIGGLAVAIGALMEKFPSIQNFLDTGLPVLEQLAGSIGTMVGKFVTGVTGELGDGLVKMGEDISEFMSKLAEASDNASGIKAESFDGVKKLMEVMGDIALTTVGTTIGDIFTLGGTSMEKFQTDGVTFFNAMKAIGEASSGVNINAESINSVIGVAQSLADLQSSLNPIGGVISWFTGRDDLGTFGTNAASFVGSMKLAFMALGNSKLNTDGISTIIDAATQLSTLQSSLEPIGGVMTWFSGRDDLSTFGTNIASFVGSMKLAFMALGNSKFNTEGLNAIIDAATQLSTLQSSLEPIGGVISWFAGKDDLGTFGTNVASFIESMRTALNSLGGAKFNTEAMDQIISTATSLATLQGSLEPIGGVISWFTGRDDLGTFGTNMGIFIESMRTALNSLGGAKFNTEAMDQIISAATSLAKFQSSLNPIGGVISWFTGQSDLGTFGKKLSTFATAIGDFSTQSQDLDSAGIDLAIQTAYRIKALIGVLKDIDYSGVADFTGIGLGQGGIGADGPMHNIGVAIKDFSTQVAGINTENVNTSVTVARQIRNLIASLVGLDYSGVADFKPEDIGKAIKGYADNVADFDPTVIASSITSANRLRDLITSLADFDSSGISKFNPAPIGQSMGAYASSVAELDASSVSVSITMAERLKNFVASLADFDNSGINKFNVSQIGTNLSNYAASVTGFDMASVFVSIDAANRLKAFVSGLTEFDPSGISKFNLAQLGSSLNSYAGSISGFNIGAVTSSVAAATQLKNFIAGLAGLNTSGVSSFKTAINELSTISVSGLTDGFSDAATKLSTAGTQMIASLVKGIQSGLPSVKNAASNVVSSIQKAITSKASALTSAGNALANRLASGISKGKSAVSNAAVSCVSGAADKLKDYQSDFKSAGAYLVDGFVAGIDENTFKAQAAAAAMAEAAKQAAEAALDINSPSKEFIKIGAYVPAGFAIGMSSLGGKVEKSATRMATTAINTTRSAMATVLDALNSDIDAQPTIRPVVDLTDIRSGANSIGRLLNTESSVGITANLNAVNSMMHNRQNGSTNDDVVSAIDKLRKDLGNVGNTTYTVGNITYDDGSNVSEAVKSLVRAARVERRV